MKTIFSPVLTAMTLDPNSGPQMPYWKGIDRLNVETAKEMMPPMSIVATACLGVNVSPMAGAMVAAPVVVSNAKATTTGTAAPGRPTRFVSGLASAANDSRSVVRSRSVTAT